MRKNQKLKEQTANLNEEMVRLMAEKMELEYQHQELQKQYDDRAKMQEEIKSLHESARRLKHDMKNHMMVIAAYLNDSEVEEAKQYVSGVFQKLNQMYTYIETGNVIVNYCINSKLQKACEQQIPFKAEVQNLAFKHIDSVDLTAILMNLLDNAIEGSKNVKEPLIEIVIRKKRSYETILIKERIEHSVLRENPNLITSKVERQEHGYGLKQVKELVERYDGMLDVYEEDGFFCVLAALCP